jgi:hypothetical protein
MNIKNTLKNISIFVFGVKPVSKRSVDYITYGWSCTNKWKSENSKIFMRCSE